MISVRKCAPEDEKAVFTLASHFATSFAVESAGFSLAFSQALSSPSMFIAVAESEDKIIGYVLGTAHPTFYASGPVAWVEEIMVKEEFRRSGVGKSLMDSFEDWAKKQNCRVIALATRRAADFYKSIGYLESATYFRKVM